MSESDRIYAYIVTYDADFTDMAVDEIRKATIGLRSHLELADGVALVESRTPFSQLAQQWRESPPVFVRHVCPVDISLGIGGEDDPIAAIVALTLQEYTSVMDPMQEYSVQTRIFGDVDFKPFDVNSRVSTALSEATGCTLNVRQPEQVLSIVCAESPKKGSGDGEYTAYLCLSQAVDNISNWAGGMRRFAREAGQVSRSEFKLLEALEAFGIELLPRGIALDLGAAPGGWTRVLRQHGLYVSAVDPGELAKVIDDDQGVRHLRMTAEEYLQSDPDRFDVIVNDMRMDGRDSARLMVSYTHCLHPGGIVIMTLKLPEHHRANIIDHALSILRRTYEVRGMKHLFHNRSEITLYLSPLDAFSAQE